MGNHVCFGVGGVVERVGVFMEIKDRGGKGRVSFVIFDGGMGEFVDIIIFLNPCTYWLNNLF